MSFRLAVIVPTSGRGTLPRTLRSIAGQELAPDDEVLLVADGPLTFAADAFRRSGLPGTCVETEPTHDFGASQRNRGMALAGADYLLFMDDDDVYVPGAFAAIRAALRAAPGVPHLFRMRYASDGRVLWADPSLRHGNVSTQMIVVPNRPGLVRWDSHHGHDYRFIANNVAAERSLPIVWREEVIAVVRPHEGSAAGPPRHGFPEAGPPAVEDCPFREDVSAEAAFETARCVLVLQLSGVDFNYPYRVGREACAACCAGGATSAIAPNPVTAALLYGLACQIQMQGGVPGCTAARAAALRTWVEPFLRLDVGPVTPGELQGKEPGSSPIPPDRGPGRGRTPI
jgi:hypothetical protein